MEQTQKAQTAFQRYLSSLGDEKAAEMLSMPKRTVKSWRLGDRFPRPAQARQIITVLPVSMNDIYGEQVAA